MCLGINNSYKLEHKNDLKVLVKARLKSFLCIYCDFFSILVMTNLYGKR